MNCEAKCQLRELPIFHSSDNRNMRTSIGRNHKIVAFKNSIIYKNIPIFPADKPYFIRMKYGLSVRHIGRSL